MSQQFARQVANLITEDPDIPNEGGTSGDNSDSGGGSGGGGSNWQYEKQLEAEELVDPEDNTMYFVEFTLVANFYPGEEMVRYYPDGSGYPGSPPETEWDIASIDSATAVDEAGEDVAIELSEELKKKLTDLLLKGISDDDVFSYFEDETSGPDEPPEPDYYEREPDYGAY